MKRKRCSYGKILAGIAGMIFLSGCSKMETQSEGLPIRISASLNVYTRATDIHSNKATHWGYIW